MLVANVVRRSWCGHGLLSADFFTDCLRRFCWHDACGANGKRSLGGGCAFCAPIGGFSDGKQCRFWGVCKLLCFRCPERRKIQGTYFKISALYFKIYGLYFLQHALCFFSKRKRAFFLPVNLPLIFFFNAVIHVFGHPFHIVEQEAGKRVGQHRFHAEIHGLFGFHVARPNNLAHAQVGAISG